MNSFHRKPCVIANWKMHGSKTKNLNLVHKLIDEASQINGLENIDIFLAPPAVYIDQVSQLIKGSSFQLAAQNVYCEKEGPFTGEISPSMLVDLDCRAVIIGHSERRHLLAENNELIARKFVAAYHTGLIPILCVGETGQERERGLTLDVVGTQVKTVLALAGIEAFNSAMIAYEPVWAIGTGKSASPEDAQDVQAYIRSLLAGKNKLPEHDQQESQNLREEQDLAIANKTRILYGGSVNARVAKELFAEVDIDGGLVGGASLVAQEFLTICKAAMMRNC